MSGKNSTKKSFNKKKKKQPLSPAEKEKRAHRDQIRSVFVNSGFQRISNIEDKEFIFKNRRGDIDDVFICENIIVLAEYTCSSSSNVSDHLLKKKIIFDHIIENSEEFIEYFDSKFPAFKEGKDTFFDNSQYKIIIIYASKYNISLEHKEQVPYLKYLDYPVLHYFSNVTRAIKLSAKYELYKFLGLNSYDVGRIGIQSRVLREDINGTVLPESYSNFPKGYKIVSFYIAPESLLKKSYVLRKDGWRDGGGLYQRMISQKKINAIRKYLYLTKKVFINNLIVTLPNDTKIIDKNGNTVDPTSLKLTQPVIIQITNNFDAIGLIDGQHRVYAYHEGGSYEEEISKLRDKQNLLVTGIIYPLDITDLEKNKFEANLFLEINSNQTNPNSELKQEINLLLKPFSTESIAKAIIYRLNSRGPLENNFAIYSYDKDKIKTTSIVSYGLAPIVKQFGEDSFFKVWDEPNKGNFKNGTDESLLKSYIEFSTSQLNAFLVAVKLNIPHSRWTFDKKVTDRVLSVTSINAFINCLRLIINNNQPIDQDEFKKKLNGLENFPFSSYKSSQYSKMGKDIYDKFFSNG